MSGSAFAGGTRLWRLTSYKDFDEGEATADPKRTKEWRVRFVCDRAEPSGA